MHGSLARWIALVTLTTAVALGGCASKTDEGSGGDEANLTQSDVITLDTFLNHPKIVAVRNIVNDVDKLKLTDSETSGCDQSVTASRDAGGKIRRLKAIGGEGEGFGEWTDTYDTAGKLRFVFIRTAEFESHKATEQRVWLAEDGKTTLFQTVRDGTVSFEKPDPVITGADRLPTAQEKFVPLDGQLDPEKGAKMTGC